MKTLALCVVIIMLFNDMSFAGGPVTLPGAGDTLAPVSIFNPIVKIVNGISIPLTISPFLPYEKRESDFDDQVELVRRRLFRRLGNNGTTDDIIDVMYELAYNAYDAVIDEMLLAERKDPAEVFSGKVEVDIFQDRECGEFVITVSDNGKTVEFEKDGIAPVKRERIEGIHVGGARKGLGWVREVTEKYKGRFDLFPRAKGTKAVFRMPLKSLRAGFAVSGTERIITEDDREKENFDISSQGVIDDAGFVYLSLLIGQVLAHFKGDIDAGTLRSLIEKHLSHMKFGGYGWRDIYEDGGAFCLPFISTRAGGALILKYSLSLPREPAMAVTLGDGTRVYVAIEPGEDIYDIEDTFALRIKNIREEYYTSLSDIRLFNTSRILRHSLDFQTQMIEALKALFKALEIGEGVTLVSGGSFARNGFCEGSDLDWYFVTDGSAGSAGDVAKILKVFKKAGIKIDKDMVPRFDSRRGVQGQDDWYSGDSREDYSTTLPGISRFYDIDPLAPSVKLSKTMDTLFLAGDEGLYCRVLQLYEDQNAGDIERSVKVLTDTEMRSNMDKKFDPAKFDIKYGRGMLFSLNVVFWMLHLMDDRHTVDWRARTPEDVLDRYKDKGFITESEKSDLLHIMSVYLYLRYCIVKASAELCVHPTGYESRYTPFIAAKVAELAGFSSEKDLEDIFERYSDEVIELYNKVLERYNGIKDKDVRADQDGEISPAASVEDEIILNVPVAGRKGNYGYVDNEELLGKPLQGPQGIYNELYRYFLSGDESLGARVAHVAREIALNIYYYGNGGQLRVRRIKNPDGTAEIEITGMDRGPGMRAIRFWSTRYITSRIFMQVLGLPLRIFAKVLFYRDLVRFIGQGLAFIIEDSDECIIESRGKALVKGARKYIRSTWGQGVRVTSRIHYDPGGSGDHEGAPALHAPAGRWKHLQGLYDRVETAFSGILGRKTAAFTGQALTPALIESGLFVTGGMAALVFGSGSIMPVPFPPLLAFLIMQLGWHLFHGFEDAFNPSTRRITTGNIMALVVIDLLLGYDSVLFWMLTGSLFVLFHSINDSGVFGPVESLEELRDARGALYYPASGKDFSAIRKMIIQFPDIERYVFTDPAYVDTRFLRRWFSGSGIHVEGDPAEFGRMGEGGFVYLRVRCGGKRKELYFFAEPARTFDPETFSVIIVKNPGQELESDTFWRRHLIDKQLSDNGWLLTYATSLIPRKMDPADLGLERIRPYRRVLSVRFLLWQLGFGFAGSYMAYRKVKSRSGKGSGPDENKKAPAGGRNDTYGINRDRHIHLEGAVSTQALREMARSIIPLMTVEEKDDFWDLMAYHREPDGKKIQRFVDMTPERMKEVFLDPGNNDPYFENLTKYSVWNHDIIHPEMRKINSGLRKYLHTFYAVGAVFFETTDKRILRKVCPIAMRDIASSASDEGVDELDLRVKFDKPGQRFNVDLYRELAGAAEDAERSIRARGGHVKINFVVPFNRNIVGAALGADESAESIRKTLHEWNDDNEAKIKKYINERYINPLSGLSRQELARLKGIDVVSNRKFTSEDLSGIDSVENYYRWTDKNVKFINYFSEEVRKLLGTSASGESDFDVYAHIGEDYFDPVIEYNYLRLNVLGLKGLNYLVHGAVIGELESRGLAAEADELLDAMQERGIKVLASLSSGLHTGALQTADDYPVQMLMDHGIEVMPSTDDPRASGTTLFMERRLLDQVSGNECRRSFFSGLGNVVFNKKIPGLLPENLKAGAEKILSSMPNNIVEDFRLNLVSEGTDFEIVYDPYLGKSKVDERQNKVMVRIGRDVVYDDVKIETLRLRELISEAVLCRMVPDYKTLKRDSGTNEAAYFKIEVLKALLNFRAYIPLYHKTVNRYRWNKSLFREEMSEEEREALALRYRGDLNRFTQNMRGIFQHNIFFNVMDDMDPGFLPLNYVFMLERNGMLTEDNIYAAIIAVSDLDITDKISIARVRNVFKEFLMGGSVDVRTAGLPETKKKFDNFDDTGYLTGLREKILNATGRNEFYGHFRELIRYLLPFLKDEQITDELVRLVDDDVFDMIRLPAGDRGDAVAGILRDVLSRYLGADCLSDIFAYMDMENPGDVAPCLTLRTEGSSGEYLRYLAEEEQRYGLYSGDSRVPGSRDWVTGLFSFDLGAEGGFIWKGKRAKRIFESKIDEFRQNDITETVNGDITSVLEKAVDSGKVDAAERSMLESQLKRFGQKQCRIYGFRSVVDGMENYYFDWNNIEGDEIFIATDLLSELNDHGPPSLAEEYLFHVVVCPLLGHYRSIILQQRLFPGNYPAGDYEEDAETGIKYLAGHNGDETKPFKGALGALVRAKIRLEVDREKMLKDIYAAARESTHYDEEDMKRLALKLRGLAEHFGRTDFASREEKKAVYESMVKTGRGPGYISDLIWEYFFNDCDDKELADFEEGIKSKHLLLDNLELKRSFARAAVAGNRYNPYFFRGERFESHLVYLTEYVTDLLMYGYSAEVVSSLAGRVREALAGLRAGLTRSVLYRREEVYWSLESEIPDLYMGFLADAIWDLRNEKEKTEEICLRQIEEFTPEYVEKLKLKQLRKNRESRRPGPDAIESPGKAGGYTPSSSGRSYSPPPVSYPVMTQRQKQEQSLSQVMEQVMRQVVNILIDIDHRILRAVESRTPLSVSELDAVEQELRQRIGETFDESRSELSRKIDKRKLAEAENDLTEQIVSDTRRRALMRLSRSPRVVDLRSQRMADIVRNHLRTSRAGNLYFKGKDDVDHITYDLFSVLKHFSMAPLLSRIRSAEREGDFEIFTEMASAIDPEELNEIIMGDLEQFTGSVDEFVSWLKDRWKASPGPDGVEIKGLIPSNVQGRALADRLEALSERSKMLMGQGVGSARRVEGYTELYLGIVDLIESLRKDLSQGTLWTRLADDEMAGFHDDLKMARDVGGMAWLGPGLSEVRENEFLRIAYVEVPSGTGPLPASRTVNVGGDFSAWMVEESLTYQATRNGVLASGETWETVKESSRSSSAFVFRLGETAKLIVMGDKEDDEDMVAGLMDVMADAGMAIQEDDVVYSGKEEIDETVEAEKTPERAVCEPFDMGDDESRAMYEFEEMVMDIIDDYGSPVIVCDMDDTITKANLRIEDKNLWVIIDMLRAGVRFGVLSGVSRKRIEEQFLTPLMEAVPEDEKAILNNLIIGSDSGTQIYRYDPGRDDFICIFSMDIKEEIGPDKYSKIQSIVDECIETCGMREMLHEKLGWSFDGPSWGKFKAECFDEREVNGRISQVAFMVLGKNATSEEKKEFQAKGGKALRHEYEKYMQKRFREEGLKLTTKVSGKSSIDITLPGIDKGFGFAAMAAPFAAHINSMIFFGDALGRDKNDEPVFRQAHKVVNVGDPADVRESKYVQYIRDITFLQFPGSGPAGFNRCASRILDLMLPERAAGRDADAIPGVEGSPEKCLETILKDEYLRNKDDISIKRDLWKKRKKKNGDIYSLSMVQLEVRILRSAGLLIENGHGRYKLRPELRDLPPPSDDYMPRTVSDICGISVDGVRWLKHPRKLPETLQNRFRDEIEKILYPYFPRETMAGPAGHSKYPVNPYDNKIFIQRSFDHLDGQYGGDITKQIGAMIRKARGRPVNLLMIGVGQGFQAIELMRKYGDRIHITSTGLEDLVFRTPEELSERFKRKGVSVSLEEAERYIDRLRSDYLRCDMDERLPVKDEYDIVMFTSGVTEYIHKKIFALKSALKACREGGVVYCDLNAAYVKLARQEDQNEEEERRMAAFIKAREYFGALGDPNIKVMGEYGIRFTKRRGFVLPGLRRIRSGGGAYTRGSSKITQTLYGQVPDKYHDRLMSDLEEVDGFIENIMVKAYAAAQQGEKVIIGLDTSWIPEAQKAAIQGLLSRLSHLSRRKGLDNIIIRRRNGPRLAGVLLDEMEKTGTSLSNIVVLGSSGVLDNNAFTPLKDGEPGKDSAFFARVNLPEDYPENSYLNLIEMLSAAVRLAFADEGATGRILSEIRDVYDGRIMVRDSGDPRDFEFVPIAEPFEINELIEIYNRQREFIIAA